MRRPLSRVLMLGAAQSVAATHALEPLVIVEPPPRPPPPKRRKPAPLNRHERRKAATLARQRVGRQR